jgi:hypothetical protein
MTLPADFIASLRPVHPRELFEMVTNDTWPKGGGGFELRNELRPADLFCYLGARFGPPNGIQNFLREDDSDNLIHWEWTLRYRDLLVTFHSMSFRTEVHVYGGPAVEELDKATLIAQVRADFAPHGPQMTTVRRGLEDWIEFVNPYQRIRRSIDALLTELTALNLQPEQDALEIPTVYTVVGDRAATAARWKETGERYTKGFGLCFGIRSMLPVMAEAYVNLAIYILMRPEIRGDDRLRENLFRQPIDVRVKSLSINCEGFERAPDYATEVCKQYHSLVNERNDLLHGNVAIEKLSFNEVYFLGTVPIFREYRTMWQRSLGLMVNAVGLPTVQSQLATVNNLIEYLESCMDQEHREKVKAFTGSYELGLNKETRRIGLLFPPWLVDFRAVTGKNPGRT